MGLSTRSIVECLLVLAAFANTALGQGYKSIERRLAEENGPNCKSNADCPADSVCQDSGDGYKLKGEQPCQGECNCVVGVRESGPDSYMQSRGDKYMGGKGDKYMKRRAPAAPRADKYMSGRGDKYMSGKGDKYMSGKGDKYMNRGL